MLTRKHLLQAAQLMHDYGELHVGAVDHDASAFVGPSSESYVPAPAHSGMAVCEPAAEYAPAGGRSISARYDEATGQLVFTRR